MAADLPLAALGPADHRAVSHGSTGRPKPGNGNQFAWRNTTLSAPTALRRAAGLTLATAALAGPVAADGLVWWYGHGNDTSSAWAPEQNLTCA